MTTSAISFCGINSSVVLPVKYTEEICIPRSLTQIKFSEKQKCMFVNKLHELMYQNQELNSILLLNCILVA